MKGRRYTLESLLASEFPVPEGLLGGRLLLPGTVNALAGEAGVGKTWLVSLLAARIAAGDHFGPMATKRAKVTIISEEMVEWELKERIQQLLDREQQEAASENLIFRFKTGMDLSDVNDRRELWRMLSEDQSELVVVDCLRDIHTLNENDNHAMGLWLRELRDKVAVPKKAAILFSHHFRKAQKDEPGEMSGASVLRGTFANVIYLEMDDKENCSGLWRVNKIRHDRTPPPMRYTVSNQDHRVFVDFVSIA